MVQVHNKAPDVKAELRRRLVSELGGGPRTRVLETHAGPGVMHRLAYHDVDDWLGIDTDPASPDSIHADNREVLRAISLQRFNLFDVDAFGSPWEQVWIISQRRRVARGELVGVAITSGMQGTSGGRVPNLKAAGWSRQMLAAVKTDANRAHRHFVGEHGATALAQRLVLAWFAHCEPLRWWSSRNKNGGAWYFGAVLRGR